jgi:hypothetical protein
MFFKLPAVGQMLNERADATSGLERNDEEHWKFQP